MSMNKYIRGFVMALMVMPLTVYGSSSNRPEELFYYSYGDKVAIEVVPGRFMLKKNPEMTKEQLEVKVKACLEKADFDWFNSDICTVSTDEEQVDEAILRLLPESMIESVRRVYITLSDKKFFNNNPAQEPLALGLINQIILKFKDDVNETVRETITQTFHLTEFKKDKLFEIYLVPKEEDILSVSNMIYETGYFEYAYPELICRVTLHDELAVYPNDPYFQYQVTLHNTGQTFNGHSGYADADIDAPEAWALTMGSEDIVVAVIDAGVTSNHPDLPNTRQVRLNGSNFGVGNANDPSPIGNENHGNACAGVIAATANNEEGIAGIAPLCKIMPIRFDDQTTASQLADAIAFAVNNGANIISNSWGYNTINNNLHPCIVNAITNAVEDSCLVIFAAGNTAHHVNGGDGWTTFPANRIIEGKLTVGASDRYDYQANYSPTDTCIDIVAPSHRAYPTQISGENLDMWSIDIPGDYGYNPCPSDQGFEYITPGSTLPSSGTNYLSYTGHFGGTSHACPVVAGVAALVLSVNPDLTPQTLCNVLKSSADKVGGYNYINGRCNEMGYGRVNANNAVWAVCDTTIVDHTVYGSRVVTGCDILIKQHVVVPNHTNFEVRARNSVTIRGLFYVEPGGTLEVIPY